MLKKKIEPVEMEVVLDRTDFKSKIQWESLMEHLGLPTYIESVTVDGIWTAEE